ALYMFVWPTADRFFHNPEIAALIAKFTNHLVTTNFWQTFPSVAVAIPFLFVCGFVTVYFLGQKGFCTYACPYGGFFGLADKISPGKIRVTPACNQCGHCTSTFTSNVLVHAEVKQYGMVVDPGCMKCMDCISVCPNDALYFGFGKPSIVTGRNPSSPPARGGVAAVSADGVVGGAGVSSADTHAARVSAYGAERPVTKNYSLTWPEEILAAAIFLASFF